jgi:predicted nucleotidyltransferase
MYPHHQESIDKLVPHLQGDPDVLALILGGSIAHGFETPASDIDVLIVVSDSDYEARRREGRLQLVDFEMCTYEGGYVDGKYLDRAFLERVAREGSEPARFAFADARVLFSRFDGLEETLRAIARYPVAGKADRIGRFYAQLEAWHWYAHEALKLADRYLLGTAVSKMVLFGGRLILAHNELLYPYHKWLVRMLEQAPDKPADLMARIEALYEAPSEDNIRAFYSTVAFFQPWECGLAWPTQFMLDSELAWQDGRTPVDDL